jgi:signal transduction protein with GAF and PtsI domain
MPRKKTRKKRTTKKKESKTVVEQTKLDPNIENNKQHDIKKDKIEGSMGELIKDVDKLDGTQIKSRLLELENENAELKTTIEKARKKLRIYSKKLDLTEEREEQWKVACYNIAGIFAEKSQVSLEDILKRFEAPIDDGIIL